MRFFSVQNHILVYSMNSQELQPLRIVVLCLYSHDLIDVKVVTPSVVCIHMSAFVLSQSCWIFPLTHYGHVWTFIAIWESFCYFSGSFCSLKYDLLFYDKYLLSSYQHDHQPRDNWLSEASRWQTLSWFFHLIHPSSTRLLLFYG